MTPGRQRKAQRAAHLAAGVVVVAYLYVPLGEQVQDIARFLAVPLLVVTGMAMWQAARLRRLRRSLRRRRAHA